MSAFSRRRHYATWALLLGLDVGIQVAMKLAGDQLHGVAPGMPWLSAALSSWLVWVSLIGYVATFVLWLAILHESPLSAAFPATALVYVFVPLCGWLLLGEAFSPWQALGIALILAGLFLQRGTDSIAGANPVS